MLYDCIFFLIICVNFPLFLAEKNLTYNINMMALIHFLTLLAFFSFFKI